MNGYLFLLLNKRYGNLLSFVEVDTFLNVIFIIFWDDARTLSHSWVLVSDICRNGSCVNFYNLHVIDIILCVGII